MDFLKNLWTRFGLPIPGYLKRIIFALYATLVFASAMSVLPAVVLEKVAVGLILVHFVIECFYPNDNQPPKKILTLVLLASSILTLQGCSLTYLKHRFGKQATDSTSITKTVPVHLTVTDTVSIPRDSVVTSYRTDTTTFHRIIETNRTRLVIDHQRDGKTTVMAESKPITILKTIRIDTKETIKIKCPPL